MTTTIALPWTSPPLTQNQVRRMHHYTEASRKRMAIAEVIGCIRRARTTPTSGPTHVTLHYRPGTRRRFDADGLAVTLKCCLDALTRCGVGTGPAVLADDDWTRVPVVTIRVHSPEPKLAGTLWLELEELR